MPAAGVTGPTSYVGKYYPGRTTARVQVRVSVTVTGLRFEETDGTARHWRYEEIRLRGRPVAGEPVAFEYGTDPVEALLVEDGRILGAIGAIAPPHARRFPVPASNRRLLLLAFLGAAVLIMGSVFTYLRGIPILAEVAARRIPVEWEAQLGDAVVAELAPDGRQCRDPELIEALSAITARLVAAAPPGPYELRVLVAKRPEVNAIAAPGGRIVIFSGLLERTESPEELAAVLAHEFQHVAQRHSTEALLRRGSTGILIALIAGDAGSFSQVLQAMEGLGALAYSRQDEEEADRLGAEQLRRARIDPEAMIRVFEMLARTEGGRSGGPTYFSSHPSIESRIAALGRASLPPDESEPFPFAERWRELAQRCGG